MRCACRRASPPFSHGWRGSGAPCLRPSRAHAGSSTSPATRPACCCAATLANVSPATTATHVLGLPACEEQSPFAIGTGASFERHLTEKGASGLLELYRAEKRLGVRDSKVRNLVELVSSASPVALARRRALTTRFIRQKLAGDPAAPNLIMGGSPQYSRQVPQLDGDAPAAMVPAPVGGRRR
jgi:hypothetical protein